MIWLLKRHCSEYKLKLNDQYFPLTINNIPNKFICVFFKNTRRFNGMPDQKLNNETIPFHSAFSKVHSDSRLILRTRVNHIKKCSKYMCVCVYVCKRRHSTLAWYFPALTRYSLLIVRTASLFFITKSRSRVYATKSHQMLFSWIVNCMRFLCCFVGFINRTVSLEHGNYTVFDINV